MFDVSGAGDTVIATMAAAMSAGADLPQAAALANVAAGIVVGKVGTAVAYAADVIATVLHHQDLSSAEAKILPLQSALDRIEVWRRRGLRPAAARRESAPGPGGWNLRRRAGGRSGPSHLHAIASACLPGYA